MNPAEIARWLPAYRRRKPLVSPSRRSTNRSRSTSHQLHALHSSPNSSRRCSALWSALASLSSSPVFFASIGMLLDLTLPVSIELGRTSMTVQEILRLGRGSVIQLDRLAGEPIDIYVGDRRFAEGEVVVLGEHFGVRITRILASASSMAASAHAA